MTGWTHHRGTAIALPYDNIDTDQLCAARFMSTPRTAGYGEFLLYEMRRDADGALRDGFALNAEPSASVMVTGRNFGSGSSREAAVYALVDAGFRVVIAPSFGDIFASNAVNNGLLPAQVSAAEASLAIAAIRDAPCTAQVDLSTREIQLGDLTLRFTLNDAAREKLINGWDDIDLTTHHAPAIAAYRAKRLRDAPWAFPTETTD